MFSMSCRSSPGGRKGGEFSHHAVQRCTQRTIRAFQDEWLRKFGVRIWKYGAEIYLFDHDVFDGLLQSVCSQDRQLAEKSRNSYAVVSADRFITVGHQNTSFFWLKKPSALSNGAWPCSDFEGVKGESGPSVLTDFPMPAPRCWRQSKNVGVVYAGR